MDEQKTFSKSLFSQPMRKGKIYLHMQNLKATLLRSIQNWIHCTLFSTEMTKNQRNRGFRFRECFCMLYLTAPGPSLLSEGAATVGSPVLSEWNLRRSLWMETIIFGKYVKFTKHCKTSWRLNAHLSVTDVHCTVGWIACVFLKCLC